MSNNCETCKLWKELSDLLDWKHVFDQENIRRLQNGLEAKVMSEIEHNKNERSMELFGNKLRVLDDPVFGCDKCKKLYEVVMEKHNRHKEDRIQLST